jgi:hypothetical protein
MDWLKGKSTGKPYRFPHQIQGFPWFSGKMVPSTNPMSDEPVDFGV